MLQGIGLANYRAFPSAELELAPLTILVGANGSGKSSILSLFLLMKQTLHAAAKQYRSPFRINGRSIELGQIKNLFYSQDTSKEIVLRFDLTIEPLLQYLRASFPRSIDEKISEIHDFNFYVFNLINSAVEIVESREAKSKKSTKQISEPILKVRKDLQKMRDDLQKLNLKYQARQFTNLPASLKAQIFVFSDRIAAHSRSQEDYR